MSPSSCLSCCGKRGRAKLVQQIFDSDINAFCRQFLVKRPGVPDPDANEFSAGMSGLQKTLFENLLLFEKLSLKITGTFFSLSLSLHGQQGAIEFVLWNENVGFVVQNIPGLDCMVSMVHNTPEYVDPERSIETGLKWMPNAPKVASAGNSYAALCHCSARSSRT